MSETVMIESLEQQLRALYAERDFLEQRFGSSSAEDIVTMVESLEAQLRDFYERFGGHAGFDDAESTLMLARIRELSQTLDPMYSQKSVSFFIDNDRPVFRAEWTEAIQQGEDQ